MDTLIIRVDCRPYTRDGPPQLGITVEAPYLQRNALQQQQKKQQSIKAKDQYQNHDYQNLDSDDFSLPNGRSNNNINISNIRLTKNGASTLANEKKPHPSVFNGAQHINEGLQITQIQRGSVIDRTGQFRVGDIIVEVNGVNLQRPFAEAQKTLKQFVLEQTSHGPLVLKVLRKSVSSSSTTGSQITVIGRETNHNSRQQPPLPDSYEALTTRSTQQQQPSTSESPTSPKSTSSSSRISRHLVGAINTRKIGVKHRIKLRKAVTGFGIKIAERDNMHNTKNRPIFITAITTTGSAYKDGRLKEGDMLLEVNGLDLHGKTQPEVTRLLKSVGPNEEVEFVVSRQENLPSEDIGRENQQDSVSVTKESCTEMNYCDKSLIDLDAPDPDDSVFVESINNQQFEKKIDSILNVPIIDGPGIYMYDIPLNDTKSAGLGLYLKYPRRSDDRKDLGIWIEKVITGGAAWKDGRLQPDDQILAINGIDLVGLSNAEASETLTEAVCRGTGPEATLNTIRLQIHRRSPSVVAKILKGTNNRIECSDILPGKPIDNSSESYQTAFDNTLQNKTNDYGNSSGSSNQNSQNDSAMSPQTQASNSLRLTNSCNERSDQNSSDKTNETTSSAISQITDNVPTNNFISSENGFTHTNADSLTQPKSVHTGNESTDVQNFDQNSSSQSWDDESIDATTGDDRFQRDGFGRQSISEKRHAQLNAKNTDTFRKNQRLREEREQQRMFEEQQQRLLEEQQRMLEEQMARQQLDERNHAFYLQGESVQPIVHRAGNVRVARNRKLNDSFRAAVDRSYELSTIEFGNRQNPVDSFENNDHHHQHHQQQQQQLHHQNHHLRVSPETASTANDERHLISTKHGNDNSRHLVNNNVSQKKSSSLLTKFLKFGSMKRKKKNKSTTLDRPAAAAATSSENNNAMQTTVTNGPTQSYGSSNCTGSPNPNNSQYADMIRVEGHGQVHHPQNVYIHPPHQPQIYNSIATIRRMPNANITGTGIYANHQQQQPHHHHQHHHNYSGSGYQHSYAPLHHPQHSMGAAGYATLPVNGVIHHNHHNHAYMPQTVVPYSAQMTQTGLTVNDALNAPVTSGHNAVQNAPGARYMSNQRGVGINNGIITKHQQQQQTTVSQQALMMQQQQQMMHQHMMTAAPPITMTHYGPSGPLYVAGVQNGDPMMVNNQPQYVTSAAASNGAANAGHHFYYDKSHYNGILT